MELILADLYGPRTLLADGVIPPDLVYGNPAFLRPCCTTDGRRRDRYLSFYAADMLRGPDGAWRVLADRTGQAQGLAYALENRRILSRVVPELFRSQRIQQLRQHLEVTSDALQALAPDDGAGVALLSGGHSDPLWFEHVLLSREMSIGLVEGGDLTLRNGQVFLKTLRGLQRIGVLLRRKEGHRVDSLELSAGTGVPGLLDAIRGGSVRMVNDAGSAVAEAPALAAFLPALARRLLGEDLQLASQATLWLGEGAMVRTVLRDLEGWLMRKATDGHTPPVVPMLLSSDARAELAAKMAANPAAYAASVAPTPSVAPCAGAHGLEAKSIALRMFMTFDGTRWRAFPGGLARALSEEDALGRPSAASRAVQGRLGHGRRGQHRPGRAGTAHPDAFDPPHRRRPAIARGRQFLLAGPLSRTPGGSREAATLNHRSHPPPLPHRARGCRTAAPDLQPDQDRR